MWNSPLAIASLPNYDRLKHSLVLIAVIWLTGLVGHFTPIKEWGALIIYVVGGIAVPLWRGVQFGEWQALFITRFGLKRSLLWGSLIGVALFLISLIGISSMQAAAPPEMSMEGMAKILIGDKLILLFPLLILAEEFLWRGLLLSSLVTNGLGGRNAMGFAPPKAIALTTIGFMLNHFAVAPVGWMERSMMTLMSLPLGIINAYLTVKFQNLWGGVILHAIVMMAMVLGMIKITLT